MRIRGRIRHTETSIGVPVPLEHGEHMPAQVGIGLPISGHDCSRAKGSCRVWATAPREDDATGAAPRL
jgi:hypothetical protein